MTESPQQNESRDSANENRRSGQPLWFWAVLVAMLLAFGVLLLERNVIRSYWWAYRLAQCDDFKQQAYYINAMLSVGEAADGAVLEMARHGRPAVRAAAVLILGQDSSPERVAALAELLGDADIEVRESAARTLAFMASERAQDELAGSIASDNIKTATAAATGLARVDSAEAACALVQAIEEDKRPLVRAQAVESLAAMLVTAGPSPASCPEETGDPFITLVFALRDEDTFEGRLALEREIDAARGVAVSGNAGMAAGFVGAAADAAPRQVCDIARRSVSTMLGQPFTSPAPASLQEAVELADSLRRRAADNALRLELPTSMPALPIHRP